MKRRRLRGRIVRVSKSSRKVAYRAFMNSPQWRQFRAAWLATYDSKHRVRICYVCGISQEEYGLSFDLHHRSYDRFGGGETYEDCVIVCSRRNPITGYGGCHPRITRAWRARHKNGLTMSLWQLTDHYRDKAQMKVAKSA